MFLSYYHFNIFIVRSTPSTTPSTATPSTQWTTATPSRSNSPTPRSAPPTQRSNCSSKTWLPTLPHKKWFPLSRFWTDSPKTTSTFALTGSRPKNWEWSGWTASRTPARRQNVAPTEPSGTVPPLTTWTRATAGCFSNNRSTSQAMRQHICKSYPNSIPRMDCTINTWPRLQQTTSISSYRTVRWLSLKSWPGSTRRSTSSERTRANPELGTCTWHKLTLSAAAVARATSQWPPPRRKCVSTATSSSVQTLSFTFRLHD